MNRGAAMPNNFLSLLDLQKQFRDCLASEGAEEFLKILLNLMALAFVMDSEFRKNIKGFNGRYLFKSVDGSITVSALFRDNQLHVREEPIANPNITVLFKDGRALMNYLLSPKPDILGSIMRQEVTLDGNLNYLYKFAYMAKRLQLKVTGQL